MQYHIDTGLIYEKFNENSSCPLCAIKKIVEGQIVHEFLNDAVMEDDTHIEVVNKGFCAEHFDLMFNNPNKLSLALQINANADNVRQLILAAKTAGGAKKLADKIDKNLSSCVVCDYVEESMVKYYKTIAQMFLHEKDFYKHLIRSHGFCMHHYAQLLRYASCAGFAAKDYVKMLADTQTRAFDDIQQKLNFFCKKHDYRNALTPLGSAENALPEARERFYGKKPD